MCGVVHPRAIRGGALRTLKIPSPTRPTKRAAAPGSAKIAKKGRLESGLRRKITLIADSVAERDEWLSAINSEVREARSCSSTSVAGCLRVIADVIPLFRWRGVPLCE